MQLKQRPEHCLNLEQDISLAYNTLFKVRPALIEYQNLRTSELQNFRIVISEETILKKSTVWENQRDLSRFFKESLFPFTGYFQLKFIQQSAHENRHIVDIL